MIPRIRLALAIAGLAMFGGTAHAGVISYKLTDLGTLSGTSGGAAALDLNDRGEVIGSSDGSRFLYSGGKMTRLDVRATSINNAGQYGIYTGGDYIPRVINSHGDTAGDLSSGGAATQLQGQGIAAIIPGTYEVGYANGINDAGQVVGTMTYRDNDHEINTSHAFIYSDGKLIDLATTPKEWSTALAINSLGQIVGTRGLGNNMQSFLYSDGKFTDLGNLGGFDHTFDRAIGINDAGQVIGISSSLTGWDAYLYQDGMLTNLTALIREEYGLTIGRESLVGINNSGQIAFNVDVDGQTRAYLLTPRTVPEPTTLALIGCGGLAILARRRRGTAAIV